MISLANRKIVLIGGAGFIGHNLALELARQGAEVEVIDSLQVNNLAWFASSPPELHNRALYLEIVHQRLDLLRKVGVEVIIQDARDYQMLSRVLNSVKPQVIIQLAAVSHAGRSNKDPMSTFDHSLRTLENALDSARGNIEHFIYLSSSMVYGNFLSEEVTEDHPLDPIGIYGALKLAGEKLVIAYNQVFDLPYTIIRPSALYGPRCVSRRVGQVFIENAMSGANLRIEGDGTERLDFTYIDDLVAGICLTIQNPASHNQIFNLTYGKSRSITDLADLVRAEFPAVAVDRVERDNLMPVRGTLNVDKARDLLGYNPQNPIDIGIPKYVHWYRELYEAFAQKAAGQV
jgi:nucleoside-diphosphate-sugar epimerase